MYSIFFELIADRAFEYGMDLSEVENCTVKCCIPHPCDWCTLSKIFHLFVCCPITFVRITFALHRKKFQCWRYLVFKRWQLCSAEDALDACYDFFHSFLDCIEHQPPYWPIFYYSVQCFCFLLSIWALGQQIDKLVHTLNIFVSCKPQCLSVSHPCQISSNAFAKLYH